MGTLEAILYSVLYPLFTLYPMGADAALATVQAHFPVYPMTALKPVLLTSMALALLMSQIHDWVTLLAGVISSILKRKLPRTVDERLGFYFLVTLLPILAVLHFAPTDWLSLKENHLWIGIGTILSGGLLLFADYSAKKQKKSYDWTLLSTFIFGLGLNMALVPGFDLMATALILCLAMGFRAEVGVKHGLLLVTAGTAYASFQAWHENPVRESLASGTLTWPSLLVSVMITVFLTWSISQSFAQRVEKKGLQPFLWIHLVLGVIALAGTFWVNHNAS